MFSTKFSPFYKNILTEVLGLTRILFLIFIHKRATEGQYPQIIQVFSIFIKNFDFFAALSKKYNILYNYNHGDGAHSRHVYFTSSQKFQIWFSPSC